MMEDKKMKKTLLYIMVALVTLSGCDNYLDVVPENDIRTIESIFEKRQSAMAYFYGCYQNYLNAGSVLLDPGVGAGDELVIGTALRNSTFSQGLVLQAYNISSGLLSASNPIMGRWGASSNYYQAIRQCNVFIENVDNVYNMTDKEKAQYKASAIAVKALYYFELVQMYGPITLVPENVDVEAPMSEMQLPRSHVDTVFNRIVELFDEAIDLGIHTFAEQPQYEAGLLNRESVYAYKAKALMYAASPLFNGNPWYANFKNRDGDQLFNATYDVNKWERAAIAADEALAFCKERGKSLMTGYDSEASELINKMRDIQFSVMPVSFASDELLHGMYSIMATDIELRLPRYSSVDPNYTTSIGRNFGLISPTMRMVELFYTENGLPINEDINWDYSARFNTGAESDYKYNNVVALNKDVLNLHLRREPRFYANIGFDGGIWRRRDQYVEMEPFQGGRNGFDEEVVNPDDRVNITGYWTKKCVSYQNYSTRNDNNVSPVAPFPKMRMAEIYLMVAEAWNEFSGPSEKVYEALDAIRERAGIPGIEEAWDVYAKDPTKIRKQESLREIIRQERMIELAFEGQRYWDLKRWKIAHQYLSSPIKGWNILGTKGAPFYNNYNGPVEVWTGNRFNSPRDYFWPIGNEEVLRSNIVQNPGW